MGEKSSRRKLSELRPGEIGVVEKFLRAGDQSIALGEMGLLPGTEVRYIRSAPMGDPLEIELRGYLLSVRKEEAEAIVVNVE
mgnify:CR=1 FL=1